jgi:hypothetical protein
MIIPTKTKRIVKDDPYLKVYPVDREAGWLGKTLTIPQKVSLLREIEAAIKRHVDDIGFVSLVAPEVLVCAYCENPADDCEDDGEPVCCNEAIEEWTKIVEAREALAITALAITSEKVRLRAIELKNASKDFEDLAWSDLYDSDKLKFLYLARKSLRKEAHAAE